MVQRKTTILLVDDNDMVRPFAAACLRRNGFQVLEAENGESGLTLYQRHREEIELVVTDLVMPAMDGAEMIRAIVGLNPGAKIVVMSGWADHTDSTFASYAGKTFHMLRKPFTAERLGDCVTQCLAAAS